LPVFDLGHPDRCRRPSSPLRPRPAAGNPDFNGASAGRRRIFPNHDAVRQTSECGGRPIFAPPRAAQPACRDPPRWRSASCSMAGVPGVEYRQAGAFESGTGAREILVVWRGVQSPQLLQLSGVGPADLLRKHGNRNRAGCPGRRPRSAGSHAGQGGDALLSAHHAQRYRHHPVRKILMECDMRHSGLDR